MKKFVLGAVLLGSLNSQAALTCAACFEPGAQATSVLSFEAKGIALGQPVDMMNSIARVPYAKNKDLLISEKGSLIVSDKDKGNFTMLIENLEAPKGGPLRMKLSPDAKILVISDGRVLQSYDLTTGTKGSLVPAIKNDYEVLDIKFIGAQTVLVQYAFGFVGKVNLTHPQSASVLAIGDRTDLTVFNGKSMAVTANGSIVVLSYVKGKSADSPSVPLLEVIDINTMKKTGELSNDGLEGNLRAVISSEKNELYYISTTARPMKLIIQNANRKVVKTLDIPDSFSFGYEPMLIQDGQLKLTLFESAADRSAGRAVDLARMTGVPVVVGGTQNKSSIHRFEIPL